MDVTLELYSGNSQMLHGKLDSVAEGQKILENHDYVKQFSGPKIDLLGHYEIWTCSE